MLLFGTNIQSAADELRKVQEEYLYHSLRNPKPAIAATIKQLRIIYGMDKNGYSQLKRKLPYFVCGQFNPPFRRKENFAYTENFIGSSALRDYDGVKDFQHSYPTKNGIINPFQNYVYIEGILFARIIWEIGEFLIPPFQKIISKDGSYKFPLREICELKNNSSGNPICYYLPFDEKKYLHKIN